MFLLNAAAAASNTVAAGANAGGNPLIGQAVVSAFVSATVALIALFFTIRENRNLHRDRLKGDEKLAQQKANNDVALAERKIALDRSLANWTRKTELAEQALSLVYEAREVFVGARSPAMFEGEGNTRPQNDGESAEIKKRRDLYFVPIERLNREREVFVRIQSLRYVFAAYFGEEPARPLQTMIAVFREITTAASIMMETAMGEFGPGGADTSRSLRQKVFASGLDPDPIMEKINTAIGDLEKTCSAILRDGADQTGVH